LTEPSNPERVSNPFLSLWKELSQNWDLLGVEGPEIGNFGVFCEWKVLELGSSRSARSLSALKGNSVWKRLKLQRKLWKSSFGHI
jgi:hypothetical protein